MRIEKRGRYWAVYDTAGELVCPTAYRKRAVEVVRRLAALPNQARSRRDQAMGAGDGLLASSY